MKTKSNTRLSKNGIKEPVEGSISGRLWAICYTLQTKLKRPPARFEYREAVAKSADEFNHESVSYQFFQWRKFNGVRAHASGRYPSRGTFTASKRTEEREAKATPKKAVKAKPKPKVKSKAKPTTKKAVKKTAAKKTAKKAVKKTTSKK